MDKNAQFMLNVVKGLVKESKEKCERLEGRQTEAVRLKKESLMSEHAVLIRDYEAAVEQADQAAKKACEVKQALECVGLYVPSVPRFSQYPSNGVSLTVGLRDELFKRTRTQAASKIAALDVLLLEAQIAALAPDTALADTLKGFAARIAAIEES